MRTLLLLAAVTLSAQELPDKTVAKYWHAVAAYHSASAELQASLTKDQKALQENMTEVNKQISAIRQELAAACGKDGILDEKGAELSCKAKSPPGETNK